MLICFADSKWLLIVDFLSFPKTLGNCLARSFAVIFVDKLDWLLFIVLPVSYQQSRVIFAYEYADRPEGKIFVDAWLNWAIFQGKRAVIGQNYESAFDCTLLCAKSAGIGLNCELSHNMRWLVDLALNYAISESCSDWYMDQHNKWPRRWNYDDMFVVFTSLIIIIIIKAEC
jgi:hypothetical protein